MTDVSTTTGEANPILGDFLPLLANPFGVTRRFRVDLLAAEVPLLSSLRVSSLCEGVGCGVGGGGSVLCGGGGVGVMSVACGVGGGGFVL